MSDASMARIARTLGAVLIKYARERDPAHMKEIQLLHTELCAALRLEVREAEAAKEDGQQ